MSIFTVPARPNATTSGGDIRKFALMFAWMRASKLRLPDNTAAATTSCRTIVSSNRGSRGPELPMHVVQPYATRPNPSSSRYGSKPALRRYSVTTRDPGARDVFTWGLTDRPLSTVGR